MKQYKCIIVDDEPLARKVLSEFISEIPSLVLEKDFGHPVEALEFLQQNPTDVLFLDINMPKIDGIQFIDLLDYAPAVVYTTAYPEHAVDAFAVNAVDYLVKPISFERFYQACEKIKKHLQQQAGNALPQEFLSIKEGKRLYKIDIADICYIKAFGDYVRIFTREKTYITKEKFTDFLQGLPDGFVRVHRSYAIHLQHLEYLEGNHVLIMDEKIPVSESYRAQLIDLL